jgi:hypothetical protein
MNERIKELAHQARQIGEYGNYGQIQLSPAQFEKKFAELIVKECAMLVEGFILEQEVALDDYQEYEASAVLKEHFGVE